MNLKFPIYLINQRKKAENKRELAREFSISILDSINNHIGMKEKVAQATLLRFDNAYYSIRFY